jgi:hypothetical protein
MLHVCCLSPVICSSSSIRDFLGCTLLAVQREMEQVLAAAEEAFQFLQMHQFLVVGSSAGSGSGTVSVTPLVSQSLE